MFGPVGGAEFLIILVLALLLFGPRKLPEIGRTLGKALGEFRSATNEFRSSLEREVNLERGQQARGALTEVRREVEDPAPRPVELAGSAVETGSVTSNDGHTGGEPSERA